MANVLNGNSWYVDSAYTTSADDLIRPSTQVNYIVVTTTAANAILVMGDVQGTSSTKMELRVAASGASQLFDFSRKPLLFPNGIRITTLTNCKATFVGTTTAGG